MGVTARMAERRARVINPLHPRDPGIVSIFGLGDATKSGQRVNAEKAMQQSAWYRGVSYLQSMIASLPLQVYSNTDTGRDVDRAHPLYARLHDQPNHFQTSYEFREMAIDHLVHRGKFLAEKVPTGGFAPYELIPRHPDRFTPFWAPNGERAFAYRPSVPLPDGRTERIILASEAVYVTLNSKDGLNGRSILDAARETLGLALSQDEYAARVMDEGEKPGGVITMQKTLSEEAMKRFIARWRERRQGNNPAWALLEEGMDAKELGLTPEDAMLIDAEKFTVVQLARFLGVLPTKLYASDSVAYNGMEHENLASTIDTVRPWCVRFEQVMLRDIFKADGYDHHFAEFNLDGLMRGGYLTRQQGLAVQRQNGIINADEWRATDNRNPQPDGQGQTYLIPLNMIPADQASERPASLIGTPATAGNAGDSREQRSRLESRSRVAIAQARLRRAYAPAFHDAAAKVLRREVQEVTKHFKQMAGSRSLADFTDWLPQFYAEHEGIVERQMLPVMSAYALAVRDIMAPIAGADPDQIDLTDFVRVYAASYAARHVGLSQSRIASTLSANANDQLLPALTSLMDAWSDSRAEQIAAGEVTREGTAIARETWREGGVTQLVWVASGDTCGICSAIDGQVVGIEREFVFAGETVDGSEGQAPLVSRKTLHPPLHEGCDCSIAPA